MTNYATYIYRRTARAALEARLGRKVTDAEQNDFCGFLFGNTDEILEWAIPRFLAQQAKFHGRKYRYEYIVKTEDGKTRLIILDALPEDKADEIENADQEHRLGLIEAAYPEYGAADEKDYNDGKMWDSNPPGVFIRCCDEV